MVVSKPEEFWLSAVGMVFAICRLSEMIDHSKGLRNFKKHIDRQKASDAFCSYYNDICRQRRVDVFPLRLMQHLRCREIQLQSTSILWTSNRRRIAARCFRWAVITRRLKAVSSFGSKCWTWTHTLSYTYGTYIQAWVMVRLWRVHLDGQRIYEPRWRTGFGVHSPL